MAETSVPVQATGKTNEACREAGPYRSSRNAKVAVFLKPGDKFPADTDGAVATWTLVSEADEWTMEET